MESSRRFPPPWTLIRENSERYIVQDANGVTVAWLFCRDGSCRYSFGAPTLTADEARRIGQAIARIPELLMPRKGFHPCGGGPRWRTAARITSRSRTIFCARTGSRSTRCKLNSLPFNATGETIRDDGTWRVYEFTWQMDAILFWDRFKGRWLRGSEFHYPERPADLPELKPLTNWPKFNPRDTR